MATNPVRPGMYLADHSSTGPLRTILRYREFLHQLVIREIKLRYKWSVLEFAWTVLNPLLGKALRATAQCSLSFFGTPELAEC